MNDEKAEKQLIPSFGPKFTRLRIKYDDTVLGL